ncbi:MAG TPA: hypothetical protein VLK85_18535, partial [Ramlibacter sp.]|nr:hypothetical protein [Ramlibacter sp.]
RMAAQRKRTEEEAAARQQANVSVGQTGAVGAVGAGTQVVCPAERANYIQAFAQNGEPEGVADSPYFIGKAALASINLGAMSRTDEAGLQIARSRERIEEAQKELSKGGNPNFHKMRIARDRYRICLIETFRRYRAGGQIDLQAATGGTAELSARPTPGAGESRQPPSTGTDTAACEAAIQKSEREIAAVSARPLQGALASQQRVMWLTRHHKAAIDANCPASGKYATMRRELQQAYDSAAAGCRQLKSGGGECTPER